MITLKLFLWVIILAACFSEVEIQIEGKDGWAKKLPTFRFNIFITKLLIGKPLTGYHIFMLATFVTVFHGVYIFMPWSKYIEAQVWGWLFIYFILEDFLWFVFNKHYGLKKFKPGKIPWHRRWLWGLPLSYWSFGVVGALLLYIGIKGV